MALVLFCIFITGTTSNTDTTIRLDSIYYRYEVMQFDSISSEPSVITSLDTLSRKQDGLKISGVKDFSFDVKQGFDQGLRVDIAGEVEGVGIEGNLSDKTSPASTIPLSEIDKMNLNIFTKNFYGGIGNLILDLPFGITDEIQGGTIGLRSDNAVHDISVSYAINRGAYKRTQFIGEEGKQSPYFLEGAAIAGSDRVYLSRGIDEPILLSRDIDYSIDYALGIISFSNNRIITGQTRIEVEYQQAIEDYTNIYQQTNGTVKIANVEINGMYRRRVDDKENPLTFVMSDAEKESLRLAGDSATVYRTYADTSSVGAYIKEDDHFTFVGQGNGDYDVVFFYVGEGKGEYVYDPNLKAFSYVTAGLGNYSPTKALPLPTSDDFYGLGAHLFDALEIQILGSRRDKNTFSSIDDENNNGFGYRAWLDKTISILSVNGSYVRYSDNFLMLSRQEDIDYNYTWNTSEALEEMGNLALGIKANQSLNIQAGYGLLNRKHHRKFVRLQPYFFELGYEGIEDINKYFASVTKQVARVALFGRFEKAEQVQLISYNTQYYITKKSNIGLKGSYDKDSVSSGITTIAYLGTTPLSVSLGHRWLNDTTFLFGNAIIDLTYRGASLHADLQQSQRYSQKRDETYTKVDEGEGDYVYDPITNTYIKKDGGDYVRKVFLLPDFARVVSRNFNIEAGYTKSLFDLRGRFYYTNETDLLIHGEDITTNLGDSRYNAVITFRQNVVEDARYALYATSSHERLFFCIPSIDVLSARLEIRTRSEKEGQYERERRTTYGGELLYDLVAKPLLRPTVGYSYHKIYSQYFSDLDVRLQAPKIGLLLRIPLLKNRGKIEITTETVYRQYNIDAVPFFFAANEPQGLSNTLGVFTGISVSTSTVFNVIYRVEFRPDEDPNQNLRLQSRIRF
jgi:hypothetical protein